MNKNVAYLEYCRSQQSHNFRTMTHSIHVIVEIPIKR